MDVRCEKCQTEYELDESRLKPGGVTVKCTNCGHMFKIRKRTPTNVGGPAVGTAPGFGAPKAAPRGDSIFEGPEGPTTVERQWVIRLENGEQKTCRELATLQQWIVGNVVTRESLISRTGKTWKRLGDITELAQYFDIADEARRTRGEKETKPTVKAPVKGAAGTMLGMGNAPTAAGGTILPDDEEEGRSTGSFRAPKRPTTQPPPTPARTPPMGSNVATPAATSGSGPMKRPLTAPPGPPPKAKTPTGPVPQVPQPSEPRPAQATPAPPKPTPAPPLGPEGRSTGVWASDPIKATGVAPSGPSGPYHGKLSAIPDEPAFTGPGGPGAGRVRVAPSDESSFETGKVGLVDDDELMQPRRGSKAGLIVLLMMLLVGAGAAALVYVFVIKKDKTEKVAIVADAAVPAVDAQSLVVTPVVDAAEAPPPLSPVEVARGELNGDNETRMRASLESLPKDAPEAQAVRANLGAAIAQALVDRAGLVAEKSEAEKLRKESKAIVLEAATSAQRAVKATPDDPGANVAMAHVLRLQGKSTKDMARYLDAAKAKAGTWSRDVALAEALTYARDGKLDDARKALEAIDSGDNKLETSNDVRARYHRALIAFAQNKAADAKPLVDQILAAQPEHAGAKALAAKIETKVSSTDPLPPEDPGKGSSSKPNPNPNPNPDTSTSGSYDQLVGRANKLAETNCAKAMELYTKALEQKPNGVEALSGQGYCHIDAKQFASAHSKFRSALAISSRFEPALWGIAEAYQQQGRREQAIEAYKAYLEVYPNTAKAQKQIERLGGAGSSGGGGSGSATPPTPPAGDGSSVQQPQKPDAPKDPTPTPAPEGGGSGTQ